MTAHGPDNAVDSGPPSDVETAHVDTSTLRRRRMTRVSVLQGVVVLALVVVALTTDRFFTLANGRAILTSTASSASPRSARPGHDRGLGGLARHLADGHGRRHGLPGHPAPRSCDCLAAGDPGRGAGHRAPGRSRRLLGLQPVVLTIAASFAIGGGATGLSGGTPVYARADHYDLLNSTPFGMPLSVYVLLALTVLAQWMLRRTTAGRQIYLVGENRAAARAAGLPVGRMTVIAWAFFGLCVAVTGMFPQRSTPAPTSTWAARSPSTPSRRYSSAAPRSPAGQDRRCAPWAVPCSSRWSRTSC